MKLPAKLTDQEIEILIKGKTDPNAITDYFFRAPGKEHGYLFDQNFVEEGKWQKEVLFASQPDRIVSGGVGTGKTQASGMAGFAYAMLVHPDFKFINVAPTANQAKQMYDAILAQASGTRADDLIWRKPERPYPMIEIKFLIKGVTVTSRMYFFSIDKNAKNIYSTEADIINIDEAGLIDNLEEVIISVGSRLRGSFRGRSRLGILNLMSNPWDNPYFWYLFDLAQGSPETNLSIICSTRHNKNITPDQLAQILKRIPPSEQHRFIEGARPEGKGNYFSRESIYKCEDAGLAELIEGLAINPDSGYRVEKKAGIGVTFFESPADSDRDYVIMGDPGTDNAPQRNSPVIIVADVTDCPMKAPQIVGFYWGDGNQSIAPFTIQLFEWIIKYHPLIAGIDSTGTQKNTAETINAFIRGYEDDEAGVLVFGQRFFLPKGTIIRGMDFSGGRKPSYLISCQFMLESRLITWPKFLVGIRSQLSNYDPSKDRQGVAKIPQDIVSALSMITYVIRRTFYASLDTRTDQEDSDQIEKHLSNLYRSDYRNRTRRSLQRSTIGRGANR